MQKDERLKILFVINPVSGGKSRINWESRISDYFKTLSHAAELFILTGDSDAASVTHHISRYRPDRVVAVGGDGTIKLVAEQLLGSGIPLGIIPAGSANGMAKDLGLPLDAKKALDIILYGQAKHVGVILINNKEISLHLSDIGLNALLIKYYTKNKQRGKWGYFKAVFRTLWEKQMMDVHIVSDKINEHRKAYMIVLANASKYGTGALINPEGSLYDSEFEVVIVQRLALIELIRMLIQHREFNPKNIDIIKVREVTLIPARKAYFQVDGEYRGRVEKIHATILPRKLQIMLPAGGD